MKYENLIKGNWYKYLMSDNTGVYGRHKINTSYINTVRMQPFINNRICSITNISYHYIIEPLNSLEIAWALDCIKKRKRINFEQFKKSFSIDEYSII